MGRASLTDEGRKLVEQNLRLVPWFLRHSPSVREHAEFLGMLPDDVFQDACMGLLEAAARWDRSKGAFSTYAVVRMRSSLQRARLRWRRWVGDEHLGRSVHSVTSPPRVESTCRLDAEWLKTRVGEVLSRFRPRTRQAVELRYGLTGREPMTFDDAARVLGITRERVRQMVLFAFARLSVSDEVKSLMEHAS